MDDLHNKNLEKSTNNFVLYGGEVSFKKSNVLMISSKLPRKLQYTEWLYRVF